MPVRQQSRLGIQDIIRRVVLFQKSQNKTMAAVTIQVERLARKSFDLKRTPEGDAWAPAKDGHPNLLVKTGAMRRGVRAYLHGKRLMLVAEDPKSGWHLKPYVKKGKMGRDKKGKYTKRGPGKLIRPARRFLPLPGSMPAPWRPSIYLIIFSGTAILRGRK